MTQHPIISKLKSAWVSVLTGILISIAGLIWAFHDFRFDNFLQALKGTNYYYIIAASLLMIFSVFVRAIRWSYLISVEKKVQYNHLVKAEFIGYFGNFILPLRLGEILRTYIVSREEKLSGTFVFGSIVLERLLDTASMGILTIFMIFQFDLPEEIKGYVHKGVWVVLFSGVSLILILIRLNKIKAANRLSVAIKIFTKSFALLRSSLRYKAIALSIGLWLIYWAATHFIQAAMHLGMSPIGSLIVLILTSFAGSIPSAPGMIGTYHAAAKYTLMSVIGGYTASQAINFAVLLHAYGYILFTLIGGYYFIQSQFRAAALKNVLQYKVMNEN